MKPALVVDVGNSRVKWGLCVNRAVVDIASLSPNEPSAWEKQLQAWNLQGPLTWAVSDVNPRDSGGFTAWVLARGDALVVLDSPAKLPLQVKVDQPRAIGMDRLLNAVAVNVRRESSQPAIVVDAGSAVTVDWVDSRGAFCGGAIFPGFRLMAQALHDHTALLPLVRVKGGIPTMPAQSTIAAVEAGVFWAVAGGVKALIEQLQGETGDGPIFLTGGDALLLKPGLESLLPSSRRFVPVLWPEMTLEGIRLTTEALA